MNLSINELEVNKEAKNFCEAFLDNDAKHPRYIFGRNEYAKSIADHTEIDGFIDDFTDDIFYLDKPVIKTDQIPKESLVVSAVVLGRPITVENKLNKLNISHLDYFLFFKYSNLKIKPVTFWNDFQNDFKKNEDKYHWIYNQLEDEESKSVFNKLINFRLSGDLHYMDGFTDNQKQQYFEDFLDLKSTGESFVDIGGFDGNTTIDFINRCPSYQSVHFFEPDEKNMVISKTNLSPYSNINFYQTGLSNSKKNIFFEMNGSSSKVSETGTVEIKVDKLDNILNDPFTFLKMDIEGAEYEALLGATKSITQYHPKMAICAYHKGDDFWRIPELVLSIRNDYNIYLRHYTEGVTETVLFFIPNELNIKQTL